MYFHWKKRKELILLWNIKIAPGEQCKSSVINYNNRVEVFFNLISCSNSWFEALCVWLCTFVKDFPSLQEWTGFFNTLPPWRLLFFSNTFPWFGLCQRGRVCRRVYSSTRTGYMPNPTGTIKKSNIAHIVFDRHGDFKHIFFDFVDFI